MTTQTTTEGRNKMIGWVLWSTFMLLCAMVGFNAAYNEYREGQEHSWGVSYTAKTKDEGLYVQGSATITKKGDFNTQVIKDALSKENPTMENFILVSALEVKP